MSKRPSHRSAEPVELPAADPHKPSLPLLMKLGSIAVHVDEALSVAGHPFDWEAVKPLIADPEVKRWIADMGVLLPQKRYGK